MSSPPVVEVKNVTKAYRRGDHEVLALRDVSLTIAGGEFVTVMGPSGSGKSSLLQIIGGLDRATAGRVTFAGTELTSLSDGAISAFRRRRLGFVFQFFHLLPALSVIDNVLLPVLLDGRADAAAVARAHDLLAWLGLGHRTRHEAHQLSGGEMQRVAIARALVTNPVAILADEPTGNLDSRTGAAVLELLAQLAASGVTIIMVTHDPRAAAYGNRLVMLADGRLTVDRPSCAVSGEHVRAVA